MPTPAPVSDQTPELSYLVQSAVSGGMNAPAPLGDGMLLLLCMGLSVIAAFAIWGVASQRRAARSSASLARQSSEGMKELLRTVRMAETIAGIGVWQYDYDTGRQTWSDGMKRLFGIDREDQLLEGDAENLLFSSGVDLVSKMQQHSDAVGTFDITFRMAAFDGTQRMIAFQACNLRGTDGRVRRVLAVARDVDDHGGVASGDHSTVFAEHADDSFAALSGLARIEEMVAAGAFDGLDDSANHEPCDEEDRSGRMADYRTVMRQLDTLVIEARKLGEPLTLAVFELDHFDLIETKYGNEAAQLVLDQVSCILQGQARKCDTIGRVEGAGFVWVMPGIAEGQARVLAERLRQAIASHAGADNLPGTTVSLGFAGYQLGDSALAIFGRADRALSEAKYCGRNRVRAAA